MHFKATVVQLIFCMAIFSYRAMGGPKGNAEEKLAGSLLTTLKDASVFLPVKSLIHCRNNHSKTSFALFRFRNMANLYSLRAFSALVREARLLNKFFAYILSEKIIFCDVCIDLLILLAVYIY